VTLAELTTDEVVMESSCKQGEFTGHKFDAVVAAVIRGLAVKVLLVCR